MGRDRGVYGLWQPGREDVRNSGRRRFSLSFCLSDCRRAEISGLAHRLYLGLSTVSNGIPQSAPAVQGNGCTKNGIGHRRDNPKDLRKCWAHGSYVYSPQKEYAKAFAAYGFRRINGAVSAALQLAVSVGQQSGTF